MKNNIIFGAYCAAVLIQNILALKTVNIAVATMTTGILISPVVFILQDMETELYGFREARKMILLAYAMNFLFVILSAIAIIIPASPTYTMQDAFKGLFATTPRIVIASFAAYCIGSLTNAWIMNAGRDKHGLFYRAISSTIVGQLLDNSIFSIMAFTGVLPAGAIVSMILGATALETLYEIIIYPITRRCIAYHGKTEKGN